MYAIKDVVWRQYTAFFSVLEQAINNCTEEVWRSSTDFFFIPARLALHIVETLDFYLQPTPENFPWGKKLGNWETSGADDLPSKNQILDYMTEIKEAVSSALEVTDEVLLSTNMTPWSKYLQSYLDRLFYVLRHSHHHLGQMNMILKTNGLEPAPWG